jgi:hypothetical protein
MTVQTVPLYTTGADSTVTAAMVPELVMSAGCEEAEHDKNISSEDSMLLFCFNSSLIIPA